MIAVARQQTVQDAGRPHRRAEGQGRQGARYGTANPTSTIIAEIYKSTMRLQAVRVEYKHRPGHGERPAQRPARFRLGRSGAGAVHADKGDWRILGICTGKRLVRPATCRP